MADLYALARTGNLLEPTLDEFLQTSTIDEENPRNGLTLLIEAAWKGHHSVVSLLLRKGADVSKRGKFGQTPLHYATKARRSRKETVKAILKSNPDIEATDDDGNTPLIVAVFDNQGFSVIQLLLNHGASSTTKNKVDLSAQDYANFTYGPAENDVKKLLFPEKQYATSRFELVDIIISLVMFILQYINSGVVNGVKGIISRLYGISGTKDFDPKLAIVSWRVFFSFFLMIFLLKTEQRQLTGGVRKLVRTLKIP